MTTSLASLSVLRQRLHDRLTSLKSKRADKPKAAKASKQIVTAAPAKTSLTKTKANRTANVPSNNDSAKRSETVNAELPVTTKRKASAPAASADVSKRRKLSAADETVNAPLPSSITRVSAVAESDDIMFPTLTTRSSARGVDGKTETNSYALAAANKLHSHKRRNMKALKAVEAFDSKIAQLKTEAPNAAESLLRQRAIAHAMLRARGVTVKDNAALIKRSFKTREKQKERSRSEWRERTGAVADERKERISKREENIRSRKDKTNNKTNNKDKTDKSNDEPKRKSRGQYQKQRPSKSNKTSNK